jgi:GNAT superfamily N-acetyltransferase
VPRIRARPATDDDVDTICRVCAERYRGTYPGPARRAPDAEPSRQRRGGGSAILDLLTRQQRAAGARAQEVAVTPGNEVALAFYRRHGFAVAGPEPYHLARAERSLVLRRELCPAARR